MASLLSLAAPLQHPHTPPFPSSSPPPLAALLTPPRPHASSTPPLEAAAMAARPSLGSRFCGSLRRLSLVAGRGVGHGSSRQQPGAGGVAFAVWKQEVLWAEAPVAEVGTAAEQLFHVVLDISSNPQLMAGHTKAGQFVQLRVGDSKPAFLAIASPPKTASLGILEFLIKYVEGSTAGLLCGLGKGDKVELSQVMGNGFGLERLSPAEDFSTVLLFATGSGISPIRSLIESGFEAHRRSDVRLYYGARNSQRMAYQDRFKKWESSGVMIVPVLSQPDDNWKGEQGYVQFAFAKSKNISDPLQTGAVLCGQKEMAQDVTSLLMNEGVVQENILKNF